MSVRKYGSILLSGAVGLSPAHALTAPPTAPAGTISIQAVAANGSDCRPGTTDVAISPDRTAFTVSYSDFTAVVGGGATPSRSHAKCKLQVTLLAAGYTYAVTEVDFRGFADLAAGVTGAQGGAFSLQGDKTTTTGAVNFSGPTLTPWQTSLTAGSLVYAPCGDKQRKLEVTAELNIDRSASGPATSMLTMDSTDGALSSVHLAWQRCP
jgi:hypothetical protein